MKLFSLLQKTVTTLSLVVVFCSVATISVAQQNKTIKVKGVVTDNTGAALAGVNVVVENTTIATSTSGKGEYTISVPNTGGGKSLVFSFLGFETQTIEIKDRTTINVKMIEDSKQVEEIVVVGYGVQNKEQITSSITQVKADEHSLKNVVSPLELLKGQVAGLTLVRPDGGDVNGGVQVQLRGVTSLSGGLEPLVVVDGMIGIDLNNVILEEIESISVLKDGSAAAIYGTRGTNGVIIITTKKHKSGTAKVEFSSYLSTQTVAKNLEVLSADEYRDALKLKYSAEDAAKYDKGASTNWFDEVTQTPIDQYYSLSFASGTDKLNYRAAINYRDSQGLVRDNSNRSLKTSVTINQQALKDKIDISYNVTYSNTHKEYTDRNVLHQAFQRNPTEPVYDPSNETAGGYYINQSVLTYYNPVAMINESVSNADWQYFTGSARINYNIIDGLKASAMGSIVTNTWKSNGYNTRYYPVALGTNGYASITSHQNISNQLNLDLSYNKTFGKHSVDAILGYAYYENDDEGFWGSNENFDTDYYSYNNIGSGYMLAEGKAGLGSEKYDNKLISFFARVQYNFDSKYLISASLRREGSSRFGKNNKWGMFPAVSAGWRIDKEGFMKNIKWISMLKPRVGIGVTGNQEIGNYGSLQLLGGGGKMFYNGKWINTYAPASNPNPDLQWEKKTEYNFGVDFGLFDGRITGAVDYYIRNTSDLLWSYSVPVPPNLYGSTYDNVGKIQNKGFEITLNASVINNKDFKWNTTVLFSRTRNKLVSFSDAARGYEMEFMKTGWISEDIQTWTHYITEGGRLGDFYAKVYTGIDKDGNPTYKDNDGVEGISDADREVVGNAYPKFQMSFNNSFSYKNFDLGIQMRGSYGNSVLNIHRAYYDNLSYLGSKNTLKMATRNPDYKGGPDYSSRYVEDASFIKIDNLTLGYTFRFKSNIVNSLRIYGSAQNLVTITGYDGVDPEVNIFGLDPGVDSYYYYPRTRIFTLGVNLVF